MSDGMKTPTTEEVREMVALCQCCGELDEDADQFDRWLATVKAEAWDEAVDALDRHYGDIYPIAVKALDKRNPYRKEQP